MRRPSRQAVVWLVALAVLAVLGWKLLAARLPGAAFTPGASTLSASEVRATCLTALARDLGAAATTPDPSEPTWDGRRWSWTAVARVDGDPLRFACTVESDGRSIVRVLN